MPSQQTQNVLLMDDDKAVCELITEILEMGGYQAYSSHDGQQAIEQYQTLKNSEEPFSAVIMDLNIPGGNGGKETIKTLLGIDENAKVIVSSGNGADPVMMNPSAYGFKAAIAKPYSIKQLLAVVGAVVNG